MSPWPSILVRFLQCHLPVSCEQPQYSQKKLTEQVTQLQAKVQSLQSSIAQSTTINEIQSYEKHCLDLITPATAHSIMKELGFPAVREIPNSGNIASLLSCGVTHRSPFAQQWFAVCQGQESTVTGVSIQKFANNMSNKFFWRKSLAVPTVVQVQVGCNSFTKYIRDILVMQFFPVPEFKQLANKDSSESDLLKLAFEQALNGDYEISGKGPHSPYISFVRRAVSLYSTAHFGCDDHDSWITEFLLIVACISQYHARASSPLSCNKDVTIFQSNVRNAVANLVGKTVRIVLPQVVYEALTHLIILKTIFTFFKGHSHLFINLIKKCNSPNPDLNLHGVMDEQQFLHEHYIADVSVLGGYSTQDIEYFINLHNKIKDECRLDKIHDGPKVGGDQKFRLAFVAPISGAASPIARSTWRWASMLALPLSQSPVAIGVVHNVCWAPSVVTPVAVVHQWMSLSANYNSSYCPWCLVTMPQEEMSVQSCIVHRWLFPSIPWMSCSQLYSFKFACNHWNKHSFVMPKCSFDHSESFWNHDRAWSCHIADSWGHLFIPTLTESCLSAGWFVQVSIELSSNACILHI